MPPDPIRSARTRVEATRKRHRAAQVAVRDVRERLEQAQAEERRTLAAVNEAERALQRVEADVAEAEAKQARERAAREQRARPAVGKVAPSGPAKQQVPRKQADRAVRAKAMAELGALLPSTVTAVVGGKKRTVHLQAGERYRVEPVSKRRRKNAGRVGVLMTWDMEGRMGVVRFEDGVVGEVWLEDLVGVGVE